MSKDIRRRSARTFSSAGYLNKIIFQVSFFLGDKSTQIPLGPMVSYVFCGALLTTMAAKSLISCRSLSVKPGWPTFSSTAHFCHQKFHSEGFFFFTIIILRLLSMTNPLTSALSEILKPAFPFFFFIIYVFPFYLSSFTHRTNMTLPCTALIFTLSLIFLLPPFLFSWPSHCPYLY